MKILLLHNRYRQPGGEDTVFHAEARLLAERGHSVIPVQVDNDVPQEKRLIGTMELIGGSTWSGSSYRRITELCEQHRPDIAHIHNFWMRLSPSTHAACHAMGVPTVQTLHNYRLVCAGASLLRNGLECQDCVGKVPWRGVVRRCYQGSLASSALAATMITAHRFRGTWHKDVDAFITLTEGARATFAAGGLPAERIFAKPNFVVDPGRPVTKPSLSNTCMYAGRLSPEKGVSTLIEAWAHAGLKAHGRLLIVGDGPERSALEAQARQLGLDAPYIEFAGYKSPRDLHALFTECRMVTLPNIWREPFGMAIIEGFSRGRPAVASNLGAPGEIVLDGLNGLLAKPGDVEDLGGQLFRLLTSDDQVDRMGSIARHTYQDQYSPDGNYAQLMRIYGYALGRRGKDSSQLLHLREPVTSGE